MQEPQIDGEGNIKQVKEDGTEQVKIDIAVELLIQGEEEEEGEIVK